MICGESLLPFIPSSYLQDEEGLSNTNLLYST
jgi:hypothetical protein